MSGDSAKLDLILQRLSAIEAKIGLSDSSATGGGDADSSVPASITGFDKYTSEYLDPFVAACNKLGGDAQEAGKIIQEAWMEMRSFLLMASKCKEPSQSAMPGLLAGLSTKLKASAALVQRNEWEKHTKTCSEGIGCLNWLLVKPAPRDFIESYIGGSDYWANGIRTQYKTSNPDQIAFCNTFKALLQNLMEYVKAYHLTGVTWNPKGVDVSEFKPGDSPAAAVTAKPTTTATASQGAADKAGLFAALNKDSAVTSGLKKVTKDMQTWRSEYKGGDAPATVKAAPKPKTKPAEVLKGPPKLEFQSAASKWLVEYQSEASGMVNIDIKDKKETVYIYGCVGANISINGKCKSIVVDGCKKCRVTFGVAMASCEVVNCQRMNIVCTETVASVAIDKTDGIVVTLPRTSLDTEVVASKSSEMNLSWPDEQGEMIEKPIPEQYVHRIKGMSITANVSDLYGH